MAFDPYSPCPCGSGKKFKWCCQPIHVAIDRAFQQDGEGQHEAAMRLMDEVVAEHPGNPEAWGRKAQLLYQNHKLEEAESALQKAFAINPDYPAGQFLRGLFRYNEGEIAGALLQFRKAADLYDPQAHDTLAEVYSLIANCELRFNRPVAAGAALRKALHYQPSNTEMEKAFDDLYGKNSRLPESGRKEYRFLAPASETSGARRAAWDRALAGASTGRFTDAVRAFESLTQEDAGDAAAWYDLAVACAWVGNHPEALDALDRYVSLETDEAKAAAAWALSEVLRCGEGMQDRADYAEHSALYQVRDPRPLIAAMQEWQKANRLVVVQADEQGTSLTALMLEAPSGLLTSAGAAPQALRLNAYLMLAGNYLRLACVNKTWLADAQREVQQKLGPALSEPQERVGPPLFSDVVLSALVFPVGIADEAQAQRLVLEHAQTYFEETWIHHPLRSLNGVPPVDAAGHGILRKKLRGVVQFLQECSAHGAIHEYDFDRLRRKLGLLGATPDTGANGAVGDITAMAAPELAGLPVETLSDVQLEQAYQTAQKLDAHELAGRFAQALVARPPSAEKPDRYPWYAYLVQRALAEGRSDAALDYLNAGEKADCEQNEGKRRNDYELRRGQVHARRGEADQAGDVFLRLIDRVPTNLKYRSSAAEAMLALKQPAKALHFAEEGLAKARQQNDRDSEGYLMELVAAAKKQGA